MTWRGRPPPSEDGQRGQQTMAGTTETSGGARGLGIASSLAMHRETVSLLGVQEMVEQTVGLVSGMEGG